MCVALTTWLILNYTCLLDEGAGEKDVEKVLSEYKSSQKKTPQKDKFVGMVREAAIRCSCAPLTSRR